MAFATFYVAHCPCQVAQAPRQTHQCAAHPYVHQRQAHALRSSAIRSTGGTAGSLVGGSIPQARAPSELEEAMKKVDEAFDAAEANLEILEQLPSARLPTTGDEVLRRLAQIVVGVAVIGGVTLGHWYGGLAQIGVSLVGAIILGGSGYARGSLDLSGGFAAMAVGLLTLGSSFRFGCTLLAFYLSSSWLTRFKEELKNVDEHFKAGGARNWVQVFCNALVPAVLALALGCLTGGSDVPLGPGAGAAATALMGAFLGYYSCCCGDTWASELGQLSEQTPRLITSFRPVRKGTNGGVTFLGLAASVAGGAFVGAVFYGLGIFSPSLWKVAGLQEAARRQWLLLPLGLGCGLFGSLLDSILGATVQFSGYNRSTGKITGRVGPEVVAISGWPLLDNNAVNLVSASCTAALGAVAASLLFC